MLNLLGESNTALFVWLGILSVFIIIVAIFVGVVPVNVWIRAMVSGAHISATRLVGMKLRHIEVSMLVDCKFSHTVHSLFRNILCKIYGS